MLELYAEPIKQLPVPQAPGKTQKELENLARKIYTLKQKNPQADISLLQNEINQRVFTLFQFSEEEIKAITSFSPQ